MIYRQVCYSEDFNFSKVNMIVARGWLLVLCTASQIYFLPFSKVEKHPFLCQEQTQWSKELMCILLESINICLLFNLLLQ